MRITIAASQITSWLDSGYRLGAGQFTYSIPTPESIWPDYGPGGETATIDFDVPDAAMGAAFTDALALWDDLIAPDFTQVPDDASSRGEVRVALTDMSSAQAAYAYYPTGSGEKSGDIWINAALGPWDWSKGGFDFYSMIHELGHVLGLEHTFDPPVAPAQYDSQRFSVMSYMPPEEYYVSFEWRGADLYAVFQPPEPATPMLMDVAAVQTMYGADRTTRAGDTTYRFEQWTPALLTIYDAGGNDTLDLSDFTLANRIDLTPGAYSSIGIASTDQQIAYWQDRFPGEAEFIEYIFHTYLAKKGFEAYDFTDNVAIALSTTIENAVGGGGDDDLSGNSVANRLIGNAGDDVLAGRGGSDWLEGGDGNDILRGDDDVAFTDVWTAPSASPEPLSDPVPKQTGLVIGGAPTTGGSQTDGPAMSGGLVVLHGAVTGSSPDAVSPPPVSAGGADPVIGRDTLLGGAGDDVLDGGAGRDVAIGGTGADIFLFDDGDMPGTRSQDSDVIRDFDFAEGDRIDLSAVDAIAGGGDDAFRFIGRAPFSGAAGELRYDDFSNHLLVFGDVTGDRVADFAIRLEGLDTIASSAFLL